MAATSTPSLGDFPGRASRSQPVSKAKGDDLGTTTGNNRLAWKYNIDHPPHAQQQVLVAGTQLTAALETPGKQPRAAVVLQQGLPASPPCFGLEM